MSTQLLRDEAIFPSEEVMQAALGDVYPTYRVFCALLEAEEIAVEWRYYKDGKNWLGKCTRKKKTLLWFSVWEGYIQAVFYFTAATCEGLPERLKSFEKPIGKLIPLVMKLSGEDQLDDLAQVIQYKKSLK